MILNIDSQAVEVEKLKKEVTKNTSDIELNKNTLGYRCKNFLDNKGVTETISGVKFTVNPDKSVTIIGTNTRSGVIPKSVNESFFLKKGIYIVSGSVGGGGASYRLNIYKKDGTLLLQQTNGDAILELTEDTELYARIIITGGVAVNTTMCPMIRDNSILDGTYEPYRESVNDMLGGCHFKYENGKFYIGHEEAEMEV